MGKEFVVAPMSDSDQPIFPSPDLNTLPDDIHLWANSYDRELADVFAIQDEIPPNSNSNFHSSTVCNLTPSPL